MLVPKKKLAYVVNDKTGLFTRCTTQKEQIDCTQPSIASLQFQFSVSQSVPIRFASPGRRARAGTSLGRKRDYKLYWSPSIATKDTKDTTRAMLALAAISVTAQQQHEWDHVVHLAVLLMLRFGKLTDHQYSSSPRCFEWPMT